MSRATSQCVQTASKINLGLRVGPRGPDGFHPVETVLQTIELGDELSVREVPGGRLSLDVEGVLPVHGVADNLVLSAARLFVGAIGGSDPGRGRRAPGLHLRLVKRVPVGAGLGGGSGDAAATLLLLNRRFGRPLTYRRLMTMARGLGADVPFFMRGGLARGWGRGDRLRSLDPLPPLAVSVVVPPFRLSTAEVYRQLDRLSLTLARSQFTMRPVLRGLRSRSPGHRLLNDLQGPVFQEHPELADVTSELRDRGALLAGLSGSGSALFALFADEDAMRKSLGGWRRPGWRVLASRTLDGPAYRALFR